MTLEFMIVPSPVNTVTINTSITTNDPCFSFLLTTIDDMTTLLTFNFYTLHCITAVPYSFFESAVGFLEFLQSFKA